MKIGIFTAMEKEARCFLKDDTKKIEVGAFSVYTFKLGNHDAFLCRPPEVGEIAAAAACQMLISEFAVDMIWNFGVVGSLSEKASLLSTVLVSSVVHSAFDISIADGIPVGAHPFFDTVAVPVDMSLLNRALSVEQMPIVCCASADKFVSDPTEKSSLNTNFGADICDMESAGVLFVCKFNNVPCLLVKCISDSLIGGYEEYEANAEKAAGDFLRFAKKLAEQL